jgi:hypothetical protein
MPKAEGHVNWYANDVLLQIDGATDEVLTTAAFQVEAEAKPNAPLDTGFLRNTIYTIPAGSESPGDTGWRSGSYRSRKTNQNEGRTRESSVPSLPEHTAGVHAAASYAIYMEMAKHFLYNALQRVQSHMGGIISEVKRSKNL